jgi:uncharacterized protein with ParB-like and HNH nuclease domain
MENTAINIKDILSKDSYIIPRYQRNYAWEKAEISQLIKDIDEFFEGTETENKSYYLGSLVCFKREDGSFELLDGQQRHTTLTLINLVLKNWESKIDNTVSEPNLKFDSRKKSQQYIENLYKFEKVNEEDFNRKINEYNVVGTGNFKDAIEIIQEELRKEKENADGSKSKIDVSRFANNFYKNVFLFRVEVPEDTDLNHYFEIMNNRGEQLEKHEIVKALLMGSIKAENEEQKIKEQNKFAAIWDVCSDMSDYVREDIQKTDNGDENKTLMDILNNHSIPTDFPKEEKYSKEKFKSIIDFPNFLLQILKLQYSDTPLDDKKLLEQFQKHLSEENFAGKFICNLYKYRLLFDKYIIKQDLADADEKKQNWGIRKLNDTRDGTIKTFNENDDELIKLQTMLYCANSTNTYNNWLQAILKDKKFAESIEAYTTQVYEIAKSRFNKENLSYPNISIFNLYFIDFLLWKLYKQDDSKVEDSLKPLKDKINKKKDLFNSFKFKQITSREHLAAQSNPSSKDIEPKALLDGIGNLCLISTSQNSAGNKESPADKKKRFANDNESLKRIIMFESFENDKWGKEQIKNHETEIRALIAL